MFIFNYSAYLQVINLCTALVEFVAWYCVEVMLIAVWKAVRPISSVPPAFDMHTAGRFMSSYRDQRVLLSVVNTRVV